MGVPGAPIYNIKGIRLQKIWNGVVPGMVLPQGRARNGAPTKMVLLQTGRSHISNWTFNLNYDRLSVKHNQKLWVEGKGYGQERTTHYGSL